VLVALVRLSTYTTPGMAQDRHPSPLFPAVLQRRLKGWSRHQHALSEYRQDYVRIADALLTLASAPRPLL